MRHVLNSERGQKGDKKDALVDAVDARHGEQAGFQPKRTEASPARAGNEQGRAVQGDEAIDRIGDLVRIYLRMSNSLRVGQ